ncbi:MAG: glycerol-3-phosphate dehydrogenase C-terminal domain-containing protein [Afipia sp.]|nr:glycerol-3-phosphate dehydrogenase C-terminal domain-containing protein [Afipia sp.]
MINRGQRETVTARALVNASGAWMRQVAETVLHLPAVQASFTKVSQIVAEPLPGGDFSHESFDDQVDNARRCWPFLSERHAHRLVAAYGTRIGRILGAAKSMDDLGPVFGDDLTGAEVSYLMREEFARFADGILWRRSKLGLTMPRQDCGALATFMAAA